MVIAHFIAAVRALESNLFTAAVGKGPRNSPSCLFSQTPADGSSHDVTVSADMLPLRFGRGQKRSINVKRAATVQVSTNRALAVLAIRC